MAKNGRFWRNVILITLAHVALIAGLIRWSLAARSAPDTESLIWLSGAKDLAAEKSESNLAPPAGISAPSAESEPSKPDEPEKEQPQLPRARNEIELPEPTRTATPHTKPTATPTPKPRTTPKPIAKPTPKKTLVAKSSTKPSAKNKQTATKTNKKSEENKQNTLAKTGRQGAAVSSPPTSSTGKGGHVGSGSSASEFGWYGNMLHDRFYSAWIQPTTNVPSGVKISTLVKVRIEKDGRVSSFEIIKPSGNVVVNESVAAVAKQVTQVDPPPTGLIRGDHYDVKINFELNTEQETPK